MKELEFEENWQSMKVGKNKPLDAEEVEFLDEVENALRASEAKRKREEKDEVEAFKRAQRMEGDADGKPALNAAPEEAPKLQPTLVSRKKPAVAVRAKPKIVPKEPEENIKVDAASARDKDESGPGLGGLLGDYGSDSDSK